MVMECLNLVMERLSMVMERLQAPVNLQAGTQMLMMMQGQVWGFADA